MIAPAAAHVFVGDLARPEPDEHDAHHLWRVLRLRPGEHVTAGDGAGGWRLCQVVDGGRLEADGPVTAEAAPSPPIGVGLAPVKGDRPEWAVQKLTEVGVDLVVVFMAARSVVRWEGDRAVRQIERLGRVAREAAMQSRRAWLPRVAWAPDLAGALAVLADGGAGVGAVSLAQPGGEALTLARPAVLVGPEGGWTDEELASGPPTVDLGSTILRAETAAVTAGALLSALRDGRVAEREPPRSP